MSTIEIIRYDGNPNVFAWKYPNTQLGTWTQLIVNESQEAILFRGGKALDVFSSGRYTLETDNIPLLSKAINLPFKKRSPFQAEVWFVNKVYSLDIKWGTPAPIQLQDPKYGVMIPVRSFGQFGIKIDDSKRFLVKLVGTMPFFDKTTIVNYFRGLLLTMVKDCISSYLVTKKISILEINAYISEISEQLKERISPTMEEYGISLANFYVNDISVSENDPAVSKLRDALAKRAEMNIIGYDYQQERSFDTLESAAKNTSSGSAMNATMGLGMGFGIGGGIGNQFSNMSNQMEISPKNKCPNCNKSIKEEALFCPSCGESLVKKQKEANKIKCSNCDAFYSKTSKFCPECGDKYSPCEKCGKDLSESDAICNECGYERAIKCYSCGQSINKNVKFCPECGTNLINKCPKCQIEVAASQKFCPECGEKLEKQ